MNPTAAPRSAREMIIGYFRDFGVLRETRAEYWGVQLINFLDSTAYFGMLTIASVYLSEDLGASDTTAGYTITVFTAATTLMLLFSGMTTDWLGIRRSLYTALSAQMVLRAALVVIGLMPSLPHRGLLAGAVLLLMAPFLAGIQTVFQAAANRYTTRRSRSAGFNLWYLAMNLGGAAAGFSIDIVRRALELPNVHVFTLGVMISVLCLVATRLLIRTEEQLVDPSEPVELQQEDAQVQRGNPFRQWSEIFRSSAIWRLLLLIALVVGVRAVYTYLYLLMPKYWLRTIGPDAAIGTLSAINPIGIVIGLALFIPFANRYPVFRMLVWGAMVSSLALFPLAVPWTLYGLGIAEAHYLMALLFMVLLTIGEVVWLPKLYEYTAAIAPKGQEGTYLGLSMVPWFLAKTGVSAMSGHALERWVPETVPIDGVAVPLQQAMVAGQLGYWQRPEAMWLLFGGIALCGCIVAVLLEKWFTKGVR